MLRRVDEARKLGEDTEEVLKEMNPGPQPTMAAAALGEWLAGGEERGEEKEEEIISGVIRRMPPLPVAKRVARSEAH